MSRSGPAPDEAIRDEIAYDPLTGVLTWKTGRRAGQEVGRVHHTGYRRCTWRGQEFACHRLAWFIETGEWPEIVDHRNLKKADNRFVNLRAADASTNQANTGLRRDGTQKGVWRTPEGNFFAHITVRQKRLYLGTFPTAEAASEAYRRAAIEHFGEFARAA